CLWWQLVLHFFFSSRRRHTRFSRDWSSDVCSSDLPADDQEMTSPFLLVKEIMMLLKEAVTCASPTESTITLRFFVVFVLALAIRSEERRVGKELRVRWLEEHEVRRR